MKTKVTEGIDRVIHVDLDLRHRLLAADDYDDFDRALDCVFRMPRSSSL